MKLSPFRPSPRSGFTLVELLVVIAIIAILASVTLVGVSSALNSARRAKANTIASQIQTAVLNYYTEYSVYPLPAGQTTDYTITDTDDADWGSLITCLSGNINPYNSTTVAYSANPTFQGNTRSIAYLTMKSSDVNASGSPKNPLPTGTETLFNIAIDGDYDGILGAGNSTAQLPNFAQATSTTLSATGGSCTAGVAVWANCNGTTTTTNPNFWVHTY